MLAALPALRMEVAQFKTARVNIDYHVEYGGHYYSVPHALVGQQVELRIAERTLEVLHKSRRVAAHALNARRNDFTTLAEHMPASHREHAQWSPTKLVAWAERVGAACAAVVSWQMEHRSHPEQGYRSCLGILRLAKRDGDARLEAACARAVAVGARSYRHVDSILKHGLDRLPVPTAPPQLALIPAHEQIRGREYYQDPDAADAPAAGEPAR